MMALKRRPGCSRGTSRWTTTTSGTTTCTIATMMFDPMDGGVDRHGDRRACKTGWVYILDRARGKPLLSIREKKVAQIKSAAAIRVRPTQPKPVGDAFATQCCEPVALPAEAPDGQPYKVGCIFTPFARHSIRRLCAVRRAATNWPPMRFNPQTNYMYICSKLRPRAAVPMTRTQALATSRIGASPPARRHRPSAGSSR